MRISKDRFIEMYTRGAHVFLHTLHKVMRHAPQIGAVLVALFFFSSAYVYFGTYQPSAFFPIHSIVTVPEGVGVRETADILYEHQAIRSSFAFRVALRLVGEQVRVQAGDYYFDQPLTLTEVAQRVMRGEFGLEPVKVVIPEGATTYQIAEIFADTFEKFDPVTFLMFAEEKEGYLFPDTYLFLPNVRTAQVLDTLERTFYERLGTLEKDIASFGRPIHEVVTMASLLEKEAYSHDDRLQIAGVLWQRIAINMPLQVDAVFGFIERVETFSPNFSDLEVDSPYNTYKNKGLPPGPIGSPSLSSIEAAVKPIATEALFYLHGKDGILRLAHTYEEHLVNRRRYLD